MEEVERSRTRTDNSPYRRHHPLCEGVQPIELCASAMMKRAHSTTGNIA